MTFLNRITTGILDQRRFGFICVALIGIGVFLRVWKVWSPDFIFYDEGFYLNHNLHFGRLIAQHYPESLGELLSALSAYLRLALASGKSLWFILADSRMFFGGVEFWAFSRIMACLLGVLTLAVTYLFSKKYFEDGRVGLLSAVLLSLLPSHIFYSRVGLQEALSTLLVLGGVYFYMFPKRFHFRSILSGLLFGAAFFSNYRMIMSPALITVCEIVSAVNEGRRPDFRKWIWCCLTFFICVFFVGGLYDGKNTVVTFAWMFYQADLAKGEFDFANLLSYPYYLFRLEGLVFGIIFWVGAAFQLIISKRKWLPLGLVLAQMFIFSFASEKGARYLCVVMPFIAMSVAWSLVLIQRKFTDKTPVILGVALFLIISMVLRGAEMATLPTDYRPATAYLVAQHPESKFLTTQPYVQNLYSPKPNQIRSAPRGFEGIFRLQQEGYRYLVLDPQAFISWAQDNERFAPRLEGYLGFIRDSIAPIKTYKHFNQAGLERFVFDHNANLLRSIAFLSKAEKEGYGEIRIYDLKQVVGMTLQILRQSTQEEGALER